MSALIGIDAGTSVIKAVAFEADGRQIAVASRPNSYRALANGGAEQDMRRTWADVVAVVAELVAGTPGLAARTLGLAVTGQGDGCWLIDAAGDPVHDGWLWLDGRAAAEARALEDGDPDGVIYRISGTGVNVCQMRTQMRWMQTHAPDLLARAATALHPKDYLYFRLTGDRATCPSESISSFGDFRTRAYSDPLIAALGLEAERRLLPPVLDGAVRAGALAPDAAAAMGLRPGLPVTLAYVDIMCCALGAGLYDPVTRPGMSVLGSTGMHMTFCADASEVRLGPQRSGYVMGFPGPACAQMQTNMAATLNIDWLLDIGAQVLASQGVTRTRADLLAGLDALVLAARPGAVLYHPYISPAGERGPFADPTARASFTGLSQGSGWADLCRGVFEGLALAARDCYAAMGPIPGEVRLSGGAARSTALRAILAAALGCRIRVAERAEAGAAGAVMIAAVQSGRYPDMAACVADWVTPLLGQAEEPDPALAATYAALHPVFVQTRQALAPTWAALAATRGRA